MYGHGRLASADFYDFVTVIFEVDLEEDVGDEALEVVVVLDGDASDVDYRWRLEARSHLVHSVFELGGDVRDGDFNHLGCGLRG